MTDLEFGNAAHEYVLSRYQTHGARVQFYAADVHAAFAAGAAWQKERDNLMPSEPVSDMAELRIAIGTLGEGIAEMLKRQGDLQAAGLRGADRGVAILKHLQEIGDNVRGVSGAIGDKFGVLHDDFKLIMKQSGDLSGVIGKMWGEQSDANHIIESKIVDVGQKVEACMTIANNTEEGLAVSIEKLDKLGVEKWREAIKHVEAEGTTEPMHAKVKAADYDESGLGKLWADVTVNLEDVSDETLHDLSMSGQIPLPRYVEERARRVAAKIDLGEALAPRVDTDKIETGKFSVTELSSGAVIILWEGLPYMLRGTYLHPLSFVA